MTTVDMSQDEYLGETIQPQIGPKTGDTIHFTYSALSKAGIHLKWHKFRSSDLGVDVIFEVETWSFYEAFNEWLEMNDEYKKFFNEPYPARSTVAVAGLPLGARVEIEMVAKR